MPLGYEVWGVGDFDGDGFRDILTHANNAAPNLGPPAIVVVRGPFLPGEKLDLDNEPERVLWFWDSSQPQFFAQWVVAAGDLNGDGLGDLAFWGASAPPLLLKILYGH